MEKNKNNIKNLEEKQGKSFLKEPTNGINIEKVKNVVIIVLSLIIVFGFAYVAPELKNCNACKAEEVELTDITMKEYRELLNGEEVSLIYLASPSCGYCQKQEPIMEELISKYNFTVNYLNTSNITDTEADEVYKLYGTAQEDRYEVDGVRTPTILIVQKGKLLDMNLGNIELEELVKLLQKYTTVEE